MFINKIRSNEFEVNFNRVKNTIQYKLDDNKCSCANYSNREKEYNVFMNLNLNQFTISYKVNLPK